MSRSTHAAWDPDLGGTRKFMPARAGGHGWLPLHKRFTRLLEVAIAEKRRDAIEAARAKRAQGKAA